MNSPSTTLALDLYADAQCAIFIISRTASILWLNKRASQITGYSKEELAGRTAGDLVAPFPWRKISARLQTTGDNQTPLRYRASLSNREGAQIEVDVLARPIAWDPESPAILLRTRDVSSECALRKSLRSEMRRAALAQERERKRAARLVHDDILSSLLDIAALVRLLSDKRHEDGHSLDAVVDQLDMQLDNTVEAVRSVARRLREEATSFVDLKVAMEELVRYQSPGMPTTTLSVQGSSRGPSNEANYLILGAAQEALRNAERHSNATAISIDLDFGNECLRLLVSDNGTGFVPPSSGEEAASRGDLGLLGLYERAALLGGLVNIRSEPGHGTIVELRIPNYCTSCDQ